MGIVIEFNPELVLRHFSEFEKGNRKIEECIPKNLEVGKTYDFLKKEQRCYWMLGEVPLRETKGSGNISRPRAGVEILETTNFKKDGIIYTKGKYKVIRVFHDEEIYFEGLELVGLRKW